ncbi:unnamed protein product, partial [Musa acuminata subsp. burmannicoides]
MELSSHRPALGGALPSQSTGVSSPAVDEVLEPVESPAEGDSHLSLHGVRLVPRHPPPPLRFRVSRPPRPRRRRGGGLGRTGPRPRPRRRPARRRHDFGPQRRVAGLVPHPVAAVEVAHREQRRFECEKCLASFTL